MEEVQQNRRRYDLPEPAAERRSLKASVGALVVVLAAIALLLQTSHRPAGPPAAEAATAAVEPPPTPPADPPAAAPAVAPAAAQAAQDAQDEAEGPEGTKSARKMSAIERVVEDGRARLGACYQRALVRDDSLVNGHMTVHVAVAASGRVERVLVSGPRAFRVLNPCLQSAVSRWTFPTGAAPYAAEFLLAFRGDR